MPFPTASRTALASLKAGILLHRQGDGARGRGLPGLQGSEFQGRISVNDARRGLCGVDRIVRVAPRAGAVEGGGVGLDEGEALADACHQVGVADEVVAEGDGGEGAGGDRGGRLGRCECRIFVNQSPAPPG